MTNEQISYEESIGKTIKEIELLSYTQLLITFTDDTCLCVTARISENRPWIVTNVVAGHAEKEWKQ